MQPSETVAPLHSEATLGRAVLPARKMQAMAE